jgi:hypothetical protein
VILPGGVGAMVGLTVDGILVSTGAALGDAVGGIGGSVGIIKIGASVGGSVGGGDVGGGDVGGGLVGGGLVGGGDVGGGLVGGGDVGGGDSVGGLVGAIGATGATGETGEIGATGATVGAAGATGASVGAIGLPAGAVGPSACRCSLKTVTINLIPASHSPSKLSTNKCGMPVSLASASVNVKAVGLVSPRKMASVLSQFRDGLIKTVWFSVAGQTKVMVSPTAAS